MCYLNPVSLLYSVNQVLFVLGEWFLYVTSKRCVRDRTVKRTNIVIDQGRYQNSRVLGRVIQLKPMFFFQTIVFTVNGHPLVSLN